MHPNARGSYFDLDLAADEHILLARPSTRALADPGVGACLSLLQTSVCLLGHRIDTDEPVVMLLLKQLAPRVQNALSSAHHADEIKSSRKDSWVPATVADVKRDTAEMQASVIAGHTSRFGHSATRHYPEA